jgi:hypothetical protein
MRPENWEINVNKVETTLQVSFGIERRGQTYVTVNPSIWMNVPKINNRLSPMFNNAQIEIEYSK